MAHPKGNAVSFQTVYCWPAISHALANGEGVPLFGTYVPGIGTWDSNRGVAVQRMARVPKNGRMSHFSVVL